MQTYLQISSKCFRRHMLLDQIKPFKLDPFSHLTPQHDLHLLPQAKGFHCTFTAFHVT